jgi:hypothetical protein
MTDLQTDRPSLASLKEPRKIPPPRILIYGPHGLGKTTWASQAPNPIFIPTEDGLGTIQTAAFPLANSYQDVIDNIGRLYTEEHDFCTVVIDSMDWLEQLIWKHVAIAPKDGGPASIEGYGFQKGYAIAADRMRDVLDGLKALRDHRGMAVILTAHAIVKRYDDPASEPYDRYRLKLHDKAGALVSEWSDIIGFATQEMVVRKENVGFGKSASRALSIGGHVLHVHRTPAFDAKSRWPLPDSLPLNWAAFEAALSQSNNQPTPATDTTKGQ